MSTVHTLQIALILALVGLGGIASTSVAEPSEAGTKIVTLGTAGGPMPHLDRSQPANALVVNGRPYLIDAGNVVLRQLVAAKLSPMAINTIFITHREGWRELDGTNAYHSWQ